MEVGPKVETDRRMLLGAAAAIAGAALVSEAGPAAAQSSRSVSDEFVGKIVLVTGGTSGIGEGAVRRFAERGAKIFFCGRRRSLGAEIASSVRDKGGEATYHFADVRDESSLKSFVDACVAMHGRIDIAFNNAGVEGDGTARIVSDTVDNWDDIFATNPRGIWLSMKYEIPIMLQLGGGRIINMASLLGLRSVPFVPAYVASKHAVIGISHAAAAQHARDNIRINVIAPGPVDTPLLAKVTGGDPRKLDAFRAGIPTGQIATVSDVVKAVEFLASDAGSYLHGTELVLDGGKSNREFGV